MYEGEKIVVNTATDFLNTFFDIHNTFFFITYDWAQ